MNKKIIAGIIVGVVAIAVIIGVIIGVSKGVFKGKKNGGASDGTTSVTTSDNAGSVTDSKTESTASGQSIPTEQSIEKGEMNLPAVDTKAGETFEVPITLKNNPGITAGQFYFTFDSKALSYVGYAKGDVLDECDLDASTPGKVNCIISNSDISKDITKNGTLITLKFKAKDDAAKGEYAIKLTDDTMICNINEQTVKPTIGEGKVIIK